MATISNNVYNSLLAVPVRAGYFQVKPKIRRPLFKAGGNSIS
jgi:hypothetical protein